MDKAIDLFIYRDTQLQDFLRSLIEKVYLLPRLYYSRNYEINFFNDTIKVLKNDVKDDLQILKNNAGKNSLKK